jgi:hypothetical protein
MKFGLFILSAQGYQALTNILITKLALIELTPGKENEHFVGKIKYTLDALIEIGIHFRGMFMN